MGTAILFWMFCWLRGRGFPGSCLLLVWAATTVSPIVFPQKLQPRHSIPVGEWHIFWTHLPPTFPFHACCQQLPGNHSQCTHTPHTSLPRPPVCAGLTVLSQRRCHDTCCAVPLCCSELSPLQVVLER